MTFGIPAATRPAETRFAATPETIKKKLAASGHHTVIVRSGAGIPDGHFVAVALL